MDCLCHSCQGMLGLADAGNIDHEKHEVYLDFKDWSGKALADSCHLCTLLFHAAAGPHHQTFVDNYMAPTYKLSGFRLGSMKVEEFIDTNEGNFKYLAVTEILKPNSKKAQLRKELEETIGHSTITQNTVQKVFQWMELCSKRHDNCQQYQQLAGAEAGLPLRLVDVDPNGEYLRDYELGGSDIESLSCKNATKVCVARSQEAILESPEEIKYLTLSHRWGDTSPTELNWDNMADFSVQIPISSLSNTFEDAILITRCLGFRYIWIDSLCINQTDIAEKANEISRMQIIYKNSQLNLSATSGESGLIFPRNPRSVLPVLRKMPNSNMQNAEADENYLMVSAGPWETYVDLGSLNERAWVVQERLHAPRVLHCCYNMVYWECPCLRASEVDPSGEMDHDKVTNSVDLRTNIKSDFATASMARYIAQQHDTSSPMARFHAFHLIVRSYFFPKQLTYPHDRLPAISGVAKWFMARLKLTPESYLAGLWQEALPECLLWHFFSRPEGAAVRDLHAGPSWSWASVISNGDIDYGTMWRKLDDPRPLFQNLQATIVPQNGDRFGQLEVSTLRLQVSVIPIEREWRKNAPCMRFPRDTMWYPESQDPWSGKPITRKEKIRGMILGFIRYLHSRWNTKYSKNLLEFFRQRTTRSYIQVRWDTTDMLWAEKTSYRPSQLYLVPIAWDCGNEIMRKAGTYAIRGLILCRLPSQGQYGRVGMFMTTNYDTYPNPRLSRDILRRMPRKALESFSIWECSRAPNLWQRISQAIIDFFRLGVDQKVSNTTKTCVLPDDHLGINDDGLHIIEIV